MTALSSQHWTQRLRTGTIFITNKEAREVIRTGNLFVYSKGALVIFTYSGPYTLLHVRKMYLQSQWEVSYWRFTQEVP